MKKITGIGAFFLCVLLVQVTAIGQGLEIPYHTAEETVSHYEGFALLYNEHHEQASWVAYELTAAEADGYVERTDDYRSDPNIMTGSAALSDYKYSGYDRGHLIPAADAQWSLPVMSATFFLSNMSPQEPGFNRGDWFEY